MTISSKRDPVDEEPPEVLSNNQVAARLQMKRPNVSKFLMRRGIRPAAKKAHGYFWSVEDVERVKVEREADEAQMAADRKRRETALRRQGGEPEPEVHPAAARLGERQQAVLRALRERPLKSTNEATRAAFRRLSERGLVHQIEEGAWALTILGQDVAATL